ncbi:MAG: DUF1203 domain-containing protein [Pseudomonadota bacterium]
MDFQIHALDEAPFKPLFALSDAALAAQNARRMVVTEKPGTPCRVSMQDADVGERVLLLNYTHLPADSPYRATHAIFVREGATQAQITVNSVPEVLRSRLLSLRAFDDQDMMIDADVMEGAEIAPALKDAFERPEIAYIHLHNARPGCFAALVTRAS